MAGKSFSSSFQNFERNGKKKLFFVSQRYLRKVICRNSSFLFASNPLSVGSGQVLRKDTSTKTRFERTESWATCLGARRLCPGLLVWGDCFYCGRAESMKAKSLKTTSLKTQSGKSKNSSKISQISLNYKYYIIKGLKTNLIFLRLNFFIGLVPGLGLLRHSLSGDSSETFRNSSVRSFFSSSFCILFSCSS